ncbi:MAG: iron-sulfur cluster assembly accessory protein [Beijerinckiaceae bacterium]|nr:iron-sulfur cluster assembly accessory protein [Beijerinckiaceae bacterium]MCZ8299843.1 iron-sulfur cluster assembly accessory protein [Beijerinckiaceae bacterium]
MALKFAVQNVPGGAPSLGQSSPDAPLAVTARAASRIFKILEGEAEGSSLRVSVEGGGCSGFQYKFSIAGTPEADDLVIERDGVTVLVDSVSAPLLAGSELDFVTELMGQSFQIRNPKATASCGCGTSFAL